MAFEIPAVLLRVLGHGNEKQHLDIETGDLRVEQGNLSLDEAGLLEVANSTPTGRTRHTDEFGKVTLVSCRVFLQFGQQPAVRPGQLHLRLLFVFPAFVKRLFPFYASSGAFWTPVRQITRIMSKSFV